ncbi:MAG: phosphoglucosamine mutase [Moraxellaceae bacterium]|nr:phosphoglucosamine mutase [Pseudobdellovibrionaceae bacterium]
MTAPAQDKNQVKSTKLFGTDGIRGTSNQHPMVPDVVVKIGQAIGYLIRTKKISSPSQANKVVIGKDTRLSGYMIEQALASGLNSMGIYVQLVGPLPTPGIGYLTRTMRAAAGIVISASHNAFQDNGIKIFGPDGFKLDDKLEKEIEALVASDDLHKFLPHSKEIGRTKRIEDAQGRYIVHAKSTFPLAYTLDGMRIVLDTAHGSAYKVAPAIFEELGAEVIQLGHQPNGININDKSGALHPSQIAQAVIQYRADVGIGLDGDADRVVMVDECGKILNGDHILALCALHLKQKGLLRHNTVVVTEMSNFGLEQKMKESGINVVKTNVGDKYVVEAMRKNNYNLGGEQSGHIIFLDDSTTGDGVVAALNVLSVMKETGKKMSELSGVLVEVPQILINCHVEKRKKLEEIAGYIDLLKAKEKLLQGQGRIFIRFSGTEPLIRILVEGSDKNLISQIAEDFASFLEKELK